MKEYIDDIDSFLAKYSVKDDFNKVLCFCPFCLKHGEPNMKPKLYYYKETGTGYCFRCQTFIYTKDSQEQQLVSELRPLVEIPEDDIIVKPEWNEINLTGLKLYTHNDRLVKYIDDKRTYKYHELLIYKQVMEYNYIINGNTYLGLFFPFYYNGKPIYYQIRFLDHPYLRYKTKKYDKILYKLIDSEEGNSITLCEGVFDVLGSYMLGLPEPVAVLGKVLSTSIIWFIQQYKNLKYVYIALDEYKDCVEMAKQLLKYVQNITIYLVIFQYKDADETYCKSGKIEKIIEYDPMKMRFSRLLE